MNLSITVKAKVGSPALDNGGSVLNVCIRERVILCYGTRDAQRVEAP